MDWFKIFESRCVFHLHPIIWKGTWNIFKSLQAKMMLRNAPAKRVLNFFFRFIVKIKNPFSGGHSGASFFPSSISVLQNAAPLRIGMSMFLKIFSDVLIDKFRLRLNFLTKLDFLDKSYSDSSKNLNLGSVVLLEKS